jgi:hypothetical protein
MASNLDYLSPDLLPLVEKVEAYITTEKDLSRALIARQNEPLADAAKAESAAEFEQRPPTGSYDQAGEEQEQEIQNLRDSLAQLHQEILDMLPTRDEWVKVNLGYGPSRVGAWRVPNAADDKAEHYEIRVVI